jgi:hypothetical protein
MKLVENPDVSLAMMINITAAGAVDRILLFIFVFYEVFLGCRAAPL